MEEKIIEKDLSYKLSGIFFNVHNKLGRFCLEVQYGDELEGILKAEGIKYERECALEVGDRKSNFADFVIEGKIILELKTKPFITKEDYFQVQRYLKSASKKLGMIINFRDQHLKPRRVLSSSFVDSRKFVDSHRSMGFTLLEVIITISIFGILAALGSSYYGNFAGGVNLSETANAVISDLRYAQANAMNGVDGNNWSVCLKNPTSGTNDRYEIVSPSTSCVADFDSANLKSTVYLANGVTFSAPSSGSAVQVVFDKIEGTATVTGGAITLSYKGQTQTITVSAQGAVQ